MALIFTGMAIYNEFGVIMARTRPAVTGTIAELVRSPGRHPITNAWIDFASGDGAQTRCRVKTWFRPTDKDIYVGAPIKVTPALTLCGAPWFPDHLHLPDEPLEVAAVGAALAGILLLCKRRHARHS